MSNKRALAWLVHLYTALGGVIGMYALILVADGETRGAFVLLIAATWIDATDGLIARRIRIWEVLPEFSGSSMDNVIDTLTYVWVPVFIISREGLLPSPIWIIPPVIAALYAYGQVNMKTPEGFFLGFPSYWNVIALYMFWLQPVPVIAVLLVVIPAILTFIPTHYLYPSRNQWMWPVSWGLALIWTPLVLYLLGQETPDDALVWVSLFYPIYYLAASFYVDWRIRQGRPVAEDG